MNWGSNEDGTPYSTTDATLTLALLRAFKGKVEAKDA